MVNVVALQNAGTPLYMYGPPWPIRINHSYPVIMATPPSSPSQADAASISSSATEELLSEANRLAEIFENIDGWVGSVDTMSAGVIINRTTDKTFIGRNVSKEFYSIMYDGDDEILPFAMDEKMAILSSIAKASDLYHRFKFIVQYLETPGRMNEPIQTFIQAISQDVTTSPHWQIPSTDSEVFSLNAIFLVFRHYLIISISSNGPGIPFGMSSVFPLQPIVKPLPSRDKLRVCSLKYPSTPCKRLRFQ